MKLCCFIALALIGIGCGRKLESYEIRDGEYAIKDGTSVLISNTGNCKVYRVYDGCVETLQTKTCLKRHALYFSEGCRIWSNEKAE